MERRKDGICILSGTRQLSSGSMEWGVIKTIPIIRHLHHHRTPTTTPDLLDPTMETLVTSTETKAVMVEGLMEDLLATATIVEAFLETLEVHHPEATLITDSILSSPNPDGGYVSNDRTAETRGSDARSGDADVAKGGATMTESNPEDTVVKDADEGNPTRPTEEPVDHESWKLTATDEDA